MYISKCVSSILKTNHIFRNSPVDDVDRSLSFPRPLAESDSSGFPRHSCPGPRRRFSMARFCLLLDASRAQRLVRTPDRRPRHQIEAPATGTASIVASGTSTRRGSHWARSCVFTHLQISHRASPQVSETKPGGGLALTNGSNESAFQQSNYNNN